MRKLPARGAPDPVTDRLEQELVSKVAPQFWLPGERVLHAGSGVHEETAEVLGRGGGEGALYLTTHRVIFRFNHPIGQATMIAYPKDVIDEITTQWIPLPGMRALLLSVVDPNKDLDFETRFWVGKVLAGLIERDWTVTEPFRDPAPGVEYPN